MKRIALLVATVLLLLPAWACADAAPSGKRIVILFTHDLHSYFLPFRVAEGTNASSEGGGYARIASLIRQNRARYGNDTILVDAGDISMGTLLHTVFDREASELRLMGLMGYDVITFGNHDFDFHAGGLAAMLQNARTKGERLPEIVFSNALFQGGAQADQLKKSFQLFPIRDYTMLKRNGLRIGVFGLLGKDASEDLAFPGELAYADPIETARRIVAVLKEREKADLIVCLSHSGTSKIRKNSEDEILAEKVPGIDVIVSGHTHTFLPQPIVSGKTVIASAGRYGVNLGVLELSRAEGGETKLVSYKLQPVSANTPEEPAVAAAADSFKEIVEREYLSGYGYHFQKIIAKSAFNMETVTSIYERPRESGLGNLVTDAYRHAVQQAEGKRYDYMHLVIQPIGLIRDSILQGDITAPDVFRVLSLGLGQDGRPGYPLISYYVNGRELKSILEVHTTIASFKRGAAMQFSGVRFSFNPNRVPFERVTAVSIGEQDGTFRPVDPARLYRICANIYTAQRIGYIKKASHGLINIIPKDKTGQPVTDLKKAVIYGHKQDGSPVEVKEWTALAGFLASLPGDERGIPQIPDRYRGPEGRINAEPSWNPVNLLAGGGVITYTAAGAVLVILILLSLAIRAIVRRARRSI